jgi:hypothetical protein
MCLTGPGFPIDSGQDGSNLDRLARLDEDLRKPPARGRRDLRLHLVRGDLDQRLVGLHPVSDALAPLDDRALGHGHAHLGHVHVDRG